MTPPLPWLRKLAAETDAFDAALWDTEMSPAEVAALVSEVGALEKHYGAMGLRLAGLAGRDSARLVSSATGTSPGKARQKLATMERLQSLPELKEQVAKGAVSVDQAVVMVPALELVPAAAPDLLAVARTGSFAELRQLAQRTARAARSEEHMVQRERRLHAQRRCRVWTNDEGAVCLEARFAPLEGARLKVALEKETTAVWEAGWKAKVAEPRERYCADALVALVTGAARTAGAQMLVRVDGAALKRGSVEPGELCEIEGVGQISLAAARDLLPESVLTALVRHGTDVLSVSTSKRDVPRALELALEDRDQCCVVPGCSETHRLHKHHWRLDYELDGPTELDNLCRLCPTHHRLQHYEGYRIRGGPGKWIWLAPDKKRVPRGGRPPGRAGPPG